MPPRIAIPMPHSLDQEYSERAILQYERAVTLAGGVAVRIPLGQPAAEMASLVASCDGILLPGSKADVNPARFRQPRSPHSANADSPREGADWMLLAEAYRSRKPVLGICYGLQSLNVYRQGSLVQHIPNFLPQAASAKVDHEAGKKVAIAHTVEIEPQSRLAGIVTRQGHDHSKIVVPVNSSHHQSMDAIGEGLRLVACCPDDGIVEALEGTSPDHFVLAVQWHPERSVDDDEPSRAIFRALVQAAEKS